MACGLVTAADRLTAGIVGGGWIGRQHAENLAQREDVVVTAVCDLDPSRAAELGASLDARVFSDWRELLGAGGLDVLWVCTPPLAHREPTLAAFELGLPVYLEKPVARTLDDARAIAQAASSEGVVCAVGYQWHAVEVLDDLAACLDGQSIGYLLGQSIGPTASRPWFIDRAAGGGNVLERGSHHIDLARAIAGDVRAAQAAGSTVTLAGREPGEGDIDDAVTILLHLDSGALATIVVAWTRDGLPGTYAVDVVASDGVYRLDLDPQFRLSGVGGGGKVEFSSSTHPFERSVSRFLEAVRRREPERVFSRAGGQRRARWRSPLPPSRRSRAAGP